MTNELFIRAERVREESRALVRQLTALRELRALERDIRTVTRKLAYSMRRIQLPPTPEELHGLLNEAEEWLLNPQPPSPETFTNR